MSVSLGIRKQLVARAKALKQRRKVRAVKTKREKPRVNLFEEHSKANLKDLKETCFAVQESEEDDNVDKQAEKAMEEAGQLALAVSDCNSEIKDAVVAVVADFLITEGYWPGFAGLLHSELGKSLLARGEL